RATFLSQPARELLGPESDHGLSKDPGWFSHLERAREWFGDKLALSLNADFWDKWRVEEGQELLEEYTPATINRTLQRVREALNLGVTREKISKLPAAIRLYGEDNVRQGFFEINEFNALLNATENEDYRDFYLFGYLIGWRRKAIARMQWSNIDMQRHTLTLEK